jgi:exopolysaccharide production protein ExoQ
MQSEQSRFGAWLGLLPMSIFLLAGGLLGDGGVRSALSAEGLGFMDDPRRLIAYGTAYLLALIWLARRWGEATSLARGLWPWWLMVAYAFLSMGWSHFPLKVFINCGHYIGETLVALAAVLAARERQRWLYLTVAAMLSTIIVASLVAILLQLPGTIDPESGRWAGTVANANHLGLMCAIQSGLCVFLLMRSRGLLRRGLYLLAICVGVAVLRGSGSATSLVVTLTLCAGVIWMLTGRTAAAGSVSVRMVAGGVLLLATYIVAIAFAPELLHVKTGLDALGRSETLTGRTDVWLYGWQMFLRHPLFGFGFDSLASILAGTGYLIGHLHNGYLDLLARGGIVGGMLYLVLFGRTLGQSFKQATRHPDAAFWLVFLAAQAVYETVESSIARPVHFLWFLVLVAMAVLQPQVRTSISTAGVVDDAEGNDHSTRTPALSNLLR